MTPDLSIHSTACPPQSIATVMASAIICSLYPVLIQHCFTTHAVLTSGATNLCLRGNISAFIQNDELNENDIHRYFCILCNLAPFTNNYVSHWLCALTFHDSL